MTPKDWADDVEDDEDEATSDLAKRLGAKLPDPSDAEPTSTTTDSPAVASLASRIGGLSTDAQPAPVASKDKERPRLNPQAPLFARSLAGVKADRTTPSSAAPAEDKPAAATTIPAAPATATPSSDDKKEKAAEMNDDGWGPGPTNGDDASAKMDAASGLISSDSRFEVEVKLADLQADPNSPLYSAKTFEELPLHKDLLKGIYAAGFTKPSKIQEKALPLLLANPPTNLIGQSQSGTGKTAAFTLDMLSRVDPALMTPQAICVAPSRELARQIQEVVDKLGQFTQIKTFLAVPQSWQRNVKIDKHILIGTPGTIYDMISRRGRIFDEKMIRVFVLDEADEMIQLQGLGDQTFNIKKLLPPDTQHVLFSATFPDHVRTFAQLFAPNANHIYLKQEEVTVDAIKQLYLVCDNEEGKFEALSRLYDSMTIGQSIVFVKRRTTADDIANRLISEGHAVASLHGEKDHANRDETLDGFRNGKTKVLITTNVLSRGIDIQQVNMVVNYDIPTIGPDSNSQPDLETYIHRIGRTGRFGRKGCSVTFVHDQRSQDEVNEIMELTGRPMKKIDASNEDDLDKLDKALKAAMKGPN
ncbi:ATP-dependent RNA helicase DBP5 [Vanrija pseudolonga]|uniref:RNA helicase n=1 Tax=Vanrija pseudolonga TaxID=143232 RepID=A0AAF1BM14_9TREE|nr:ATP-dependent RNA helicase DBP5 [Vanrija pseudolonga]